MGAFHYPLEAAGARPLTAAAGLASAAFVTPVAHATTIYIEPDAALSVDISGTSAGSNSLDSLGNLFMALNEHVAHKADTSKVGIAARTGGTGGSRVNTGGFSGAGEVEGSLSTPVPDAAAL